MNKRIMIIAIEFISFLLGVFYNAIQSAYQTAKNYYLDRDIEMYVRKDVARLEKLSVEQGDTIAYRQLFEYDIPDRDFLYISFIMANKYHYSRAFYDIYSMDTDRFEHYLRRGAKLENKECLMAIEPNDTVETPETPDLKRIRIFNYK